MNTLEIPGKLREIGLSEKEALVYASLIASGGNYPSKIASETKLNRSTVYKILLDLSVKGLVNEIEKKNKLFYQVERPDRLLRYVKSQITKANDHFEAAEKLIPDFEGMFAAFTNKPRVLYFEGKEGILSLYEDMIAGTEKYEMLAFSNAAELEQVFPEKFFENFRRKKEKIGITTRAIAPDTEKDQSYNERFFAGYTKEVIPVIRHVPAAEFPYKGEITIYGGKKVSIVDLKKEHLTGVLIEDETIHNLMRMIFEMSWKGTGK